MIIIKHKNLHPLLKDVSGNIVSQRLGTIGGLCLYPTLALVSQIPQIALYAPVCSATHFSAMIYNYCQAKQLFQHGLIDAKESYHYSALSKEYNYFKFNFHGDLVFSQRKSFLYLSLNQDKPFMAQSFGIDKLKLNPIISTYGSTVISNYHLKNDTRQKLEELMDQRRMRFRYPLIVGSVATMMGSLVDTLLAPTAFIMGYTIGLLTNPNVSKYLSTQLFIKLEQQKEDMINPLFQSKYKELEWDQKYIYVNFYGDLVMRKDKPFLRSSIFLTNKKNT